MAGPRRSWARCCARQDGAARPISSRPSSTGDSTTARMKRTRYRPPGTRLLAVGTRGVGPRGVGPRSVGLRGAGRGGRPAGLGLVRLGLGRLQRLRDGCREGFLLAGLGLGHLERSLGSGQPLELLPVAGDLQDPADRVGWLGSHRQPVLCPLGVDLDVGGLRLGVVLADLLDRPAVTLMKAWLRAVNTPGEEPVAWPDGPGPPSERGRRRPGNESNPAIVPDTATPDVIVMLPAPGHPAAAPRAGHRFVATKGRHHDPDQPQTGASGRLGHRKANIAELGERYGPVRVSGRRACPGGSG